MYSTMYADSALTSGVASPLSSVMGFFAAYSILILIVAVVCTIANWIIFKKAGQPGWASIVPIYANVVQFKVVGLNPWLILLYLIPFVNYVAMVVFAILIAFRLAKSFGKSTGWGWGLLFLPFIFQLILAFGSSEYVGPNGNT